MNIAFITFRLPHPPYRGDRLHVAEILRTLSGRHNVTLFALASGKESPEDHRAVASICRTIAVPHRVGPAWTRACLGLASPEPSQVLFCRSKGMRDALRRESRSNPPDLVIAHSIRMAQHARVVDGAKRILFLCDALGELLAERARYAPWWLKPALHWERARLDSYTSRHRRAFHDAWVFSPVDQAYQHAHGCPAVRVVRHGVSRAVAPVRHSPRSAPHIMFLGNLSVAHNIDAAEFAARAVFPLVQESHPAAQLVLAGADPTARVRRLALRSGVTVPGMIRDLGPLWAEATVFLAPVRYSAGIQNKVLEVAVAGVPIVTTPRVARGIGLEHDVHALVARDAQGLAAAVREVIDRPEEARARAELARDRVTREFRWECALEAIEDSMAST